MVSDIIRHDDTDDKPGVDGTPGWAYDEDGYCVACGNGRWKHHMPECELRDALDAVAIVRALAASDPTVASEVTGDPYCALCSDIGGLDHDDDCPLLRARAWVSAHPVSGAEVEA